MSVIEHAPGEVADDVLITRVRGGDLDAYGDLFARHKDAALRLARSLTKGADADDLVSDAFAKVLNALQSGSGPDIAFRAYLLTAVRRLHIDRARGHARATPTDDIAALDQGVPFSDTAVAAFESSTAARAFGSLPERWQMVLWHLEVEGQKPADVAPLLGMTPNAVAALAYRAREGLRQAFVQMHATEEAETTQDCREVREQLGAYVREGLSKRDRTKVSDHLEGCRRCTALYLELSEVNSSLAALLGPIVLGSAAAAYLAGTTAVASTGGLLTSLGLIFGRVRDVVVANSTAAAVTGAAVVAGSVGVAAYAVNHHAPNQPTAQAPIVQEHQPSVAPSPAARATKKPRPKPRPTQASSPAVVVPAPPMPTASIEAPSAAPTKPTPSNSPNPTPTPTPTPPPPVVAPISVSGPTSARRIAVVTVHGLTDGDTGTVTLHLPPALPWWITPGCRHGLWTRSCPVSAGSPTVTVKFVGLIDRTFSATFTPGPGVQDDNVGDNRVVVKMRGLIPIGLPTDPR